SALVDDSGAFLIKRYTFTYLTSGRDLLRLGIKTRAQGGGVIFADPSFDLVAPAAAATPAQSDAAPTTRGRRSADLSLQSWKPLPAPAEEAGDVARRLHGVTVFRAATPTGPALRPVHAPQTLPLAPHGFFRPDEAPPDPAADPAARAAPAGPVPPTEGRENPL